MTTISNPGGTPSVTYNREGVAIDHFTVSTGYGTIVRYSGHTIAVINFNGSLASGVYMPDDAEIGDIVEVYDQQNETMPLYPESGGEINGHGVDTPITVGHARFVRTSSGKWFGIYN